MTNIFLGLAYSIPIAIVAYKKNSLSESGAIASIILGTGMFFFGGFIPSVLMVMFFVSSSIISKLKRKSKKKLEDMNEKGSRRDYIQVFANGGVAFILSIFYFFTGNFIFLIAIAVSFAEANSDTWASEIGVLSKKAPVSILNFKKLESGMSGGVSVLGTFAAFSGSTFIAIIFALLNVIQFESYDELLQIFILISLIGFAGSIIDSVLGAGIQSGYYDKDTDIYTEKEKSNGKKNTLIKGFKIINNDVVNILSNIITVIITFIIF